MPCQLPMHSPPSGQRPARHASSARVLRQPPHESCTENDCHSCIHHLFVGLCCPLIRQRYQAQRDVHADAGRREYEYVHLPNSSTAFANAVPINLGPQATDEQKVLASFGFPDFKQVPPGRLNTIKTFDLSLHGYLLDANGQQHGPLSSAAANGYATAGISNAMSSGA